MKKSIKRIIAAISAAVVCALPTVNAITSSAAKATQKNTYKIETIMHGGSDRVYFLHIDRYFNSAIKNSVTLRNSSFQLPCNSFSAKMPQQGRMVFSAESSALRRYDGVVSIDTFDVPASVTPAQFKWNFYATATGNYYLGDGTLYTEYEDSMEERVHLVGDANGDGVIMMNDVVVIQQYLINVLDEDEIDLIAADANGDGTVDENDGELIQRYLLGSINSFADYQF